MRRRARGRTNEGAEDCIVVIFGASGDLTKRKLLPALSALYRQDLLPERFAVLGVSRSQMSGETFRARVAESVEQYSRDDAIDAEKLREFAQRVHYEPVDTSSAEGYGQLKARLAALDAEYRTGGNCMYYLAMPPRLYEPTAAHLGHSGLNAQGDGTGWKRIVIEKPFGHDLESARALNGDLLKVFHEDQIYRIDHYLGKETVQNVLVFRFSNGIFEPLWNRNYVRYVEITSAEHIGMEGRGAYYDRAGVVRDMVQNHLLQIVGLMAMEPPSSFDADAIRNESLKVFQSLRPLTERQIAENVVRGQYMPSTVRGESLAGYRDEEGVAPDSRTETFVALRFHIDNWRWGGTPFLLRAGKRLPTRVTEVVIHFKPTPHRLLGPETGFPQGRNQLIIRIQPDEGILLRFGMKLPGAGFEVKDVAMDFHYSDLSDTHISEPYERLLLDCMLGDATLYARNDVVEACWAFVDPILEAWEAKPDAKLYGYPAGTWGPKEADALVRGHADQWRHPCKNLAQDGQYCEL
ncbi:MAG: glucose-6-phosphate dehydrogenase [Armatimonadota bacterium]|jgi:glucose-6-phosphate 1-dehydrogenase